MDKRLNDLLKSMILDAKLPQYVYRMRPVNDRLFEILEENEMYFASAKTFNDPFDCNININLEDSLDHEIEEYYEYLRKINSSTKKSPIAKVSLSDLQDKLNLAFKNIAYKKGVSCFLGNNGNLLMWAHYAGSHNGVCLKFDMLEDTTFFGGAKQVSYSLTYPKYNYLKDKDAVVELLFVKSTDWDYEDEIRVVKNAPGKYPFKKNALKEVILGVNISEDDKEKIKKILVDKYPHTLILQSQKKPNEFGLEFMPL